ncbi:TPA: S-layer protein SlpA [Clostridioides difficile]|nr:S-layer protein SlpA [Clostridioides difficile]HBF4060050.1 S-layer protein SlpA [Clostridioides difficile]
MNKKNIAIAMSGLTVLASAASVFADSVKSEYITVQKDYKETLKKIQAGMLDGSISEIAVKYNGKEVPKFTADTASADKLKASAEQFYNAVEPQLKNLDDGDSAEFILKYDLGDKIYTEAEINSLKDRLEKTVVLNPAVKDGRPGLVMEDEASNTKPADKSLTVGDLFTLTPASDGGTIGGYKLTATAKEVTALGDYKYGTVTTEGVEFGDAANKALVKSEDGTGALKAGAILDENKSFKFDTATGKTSTFTLQADPYFENGTTSVKVINAKETTIDVSSSSSTSAEDLAKKYVFTQKTLDDIYDVLDKHENGYDNDKVLLVNGKYQVVLYPEGKRLTTKGDTNIANSPVKLVLKSDNRKDMKDYIDDLKTYNNSYSNVVTVAGDDRIETAIELSNKYYNSDDDKAVTDIAADNVVLVGSQAIVDGLVASPLASEKHAPLLLTSKDKLDANVKSEIKRVMDLKSTSGINTSKKVYLAGGVNSISKDVENELKDMGLKVVRLAGDDRYETSLEIADEIGLDNDKAFVVGGTGLADAMSIAPVASQLKASNGDFDVADGDATPIVVVDGKAKDINAATQDFLDNAQVDIIGGTNSVSKDVEQAIEDATGKEPNRTSGDDRQATNAEVMKETDYFKKAEVENYFVAKDGSTKEDQLVDALAAAPVAANFGATYKGTTTDPSGEVSPAPIVLATDSLSADQNVGVSKSVKDSGGKNLVQVGKGIASSVMSKMKDLLDM